MKPILKYVIQRNDIDDSIFLRASGITHEIKDPDKKWSRFFSFLDGNNTGEGIADLSKMDVKEVLDACDT